MRAAVSSWALVCPTGLGCPQKVWDPGAAYIHGQRVAQWRNAKVDRPVPALHAPVDSPIYHAHGAEIFPDSDTTRYAHCACTAVISLCSGDACTSADRYALSAAQSHSSDASWLQPGHAVPAGKVLKEELCLHPHAQA